MRAASREQARLHPSSSQLRDMFSFVFKLFFICILLGMHLTQPKPTNRICSPQLDEIYHNMLWLLKEVHTQMYFCFFAHFIVEITAESENRYL
jgi:hypothetical protein